jgi:hypothetical protein
MVEKNAGFRSWLAGLAKDKATRSLSTPAFREASKDFARDLGESVIQGGKKELTPLLKEIQETVKKEAPEVAGQMVDKATRQAEESLSSLVRRLSAAATLGGMAGAAMAPAGDRTQGAVRGAVGGVIGGATGAAWGKSLLPAVGGAILGGAAGGATLRKNQGTPQAKENAMQGFKYAGVTLDWYDDRGETLKQKFPTLDSVPDIIKTANVLPKEKLANEQFALVMIDRGHVFRKFACADPGTTAMSTIYFMEHGDKLPEDAQKIAASNLVKACIRNGIMPPAAMTKVSEADIIAGGFADGHKAKEYPSKQMEMGQKVEMEHTDTAALAKEIAKDHLEEIPDYYDRLDKMEEVAKQQGKFNEKAEEKDKERQQREKAASANDNVIDITGKLPTPKLKKASLSDDDYALVLPNGTRKYPINSWNLVKKASEYYQENRLRMHPEHRRQYAVKLARKSFIIGFPLEKEIAELGAASYGDNGQLKVAVEMRKVACDPKGPGREFLNDLFEKHASMNPEVYAEVLRRFDIEEGLDRGWDHVIPDPWASTFGIKTASVVWEDAADRVTDDELINLAQNHLQKLQLEWTQDFANEFRKDPVGVFNSLPTPQKRLLARSAADLSSSGESEHAEPKNRANG